MGFLPIVATSNNEASETDAVCFFLMISKDFIITEGDRD
jgi:hypothetical protein